MKRTLSTADMREQCRRDLWLAIGFLPGQLPSGDWERALKAVRRLTQQIGDVKKAVR